LSRRPAISGGGERVRWRIRGNLRLADRIVFIRLVHRQVWGALVGVYCMNLGQVVVLQELLRCKEFSLRDLRGRVPGFPVLQNLTSFLSRVVLLEHIRVEDVIVKDVLLDLAGLDSLDTG
jgi:hypothetical protein